MEKVNSGADYECFSSPSDYSFHINIRKSQEYGKPKVTSSYEEVNALSLSFSEDFSPISESIFYFLPLYLKTVLNININLKFSLLYKREATLEATSSLISFLSEKDILNKTIETKINRLNLIDSKGKNLENLSYIFHIISKKYYKYLDKPKEKECMESLYKVIVDKKKGSLLKSLRYYNYIDDKKIRKVVKNVYSDINKKRPEEEFEGESVNFKDKTKKAFGKEDEITIQEIKNLYNSDRNLYKEWSEAKLKMNKTLKVVLTDLWKDRNLPNSIPVSEMNRILRELGVESPIDKGFDGKVSLGRTSSSLFVYHTKSGLELEANPGTKVEMNPNYDPKLDDTYYCTCFPFNFSSTNNSKDRIRIYTLKYRKEASSSIFNDAISVGNVIEGCRDEWKENLNIKFSKKNIEKETILSALCMLGDVTCGRIGSRDATVEGTDGLRTLKGKNLKIGKNKVIITYEGKARVKQKHVIEDNPLKEFLIFMKRNRKPNEYIFSIKGKKPIRFKDVNEFLREKGISNFHKFRHYHACRMFSDFLDDYFESNWTNEKAIKEFNKIVQEISKLLGNSVNICLRRYIDPRMLYRFWESVGFGNAPKSILKILRDAFLLPDEYL